MKKNFKISCLILAVVMVFMAMPAWAVNDIVLEDFDILTLDDLELFTAIELDIPTENISIEIIEDEEIYLNAERVSTSSSSCVSLPAAWSSPTGRCACPSGVPNLTTITQRTTTWATYNDCTNSFLRDNQYCVNCNVIMYLSAGYSPSCTCHTGLVHVSGNQWRCNSCGWSGYRP